MSSSAINLKSFVNKIVSSLKYINGSSLSATHQSAVSSILLGTNTGEQSKLLNVRSAIEVINRLRRLAGKTANFTLTNASTYGSYAVSVNTAKSIIAKEDLSQSNYKFTYLNLYHNTTTANSNNANAQYRALQSGTIVGTLYGGGSGGKGAWACSNGKNGGGNTITVGSTGAGGISYVYTKTLTGALTQTSSASGGDSVGASSVSTSNGSATTQYLACGNGADGNSGKTASSSFSVNSSTGFRFVFGAGGGGSGGSSFNCDSQTSISSVSGNASGSNGSSPAQNNQWTAHATTWASGGGGGAPSGSTNTSIATSGSSFGYGTVTSATSASATQAGNPARTSTVNSMSANTTIGQGGAGGKSSAFGNKDSYSGQVNGGGELVATGGQGGMRGGFKVTSGGDLLLIQVDNIETLQAV